MTHIDPHIAELAYDDPREKLWVLVSSTHDPADCEGCLEAMRSAINNAQATGSVGGSVFLDNSHLSTPTASHRAEVYRGREIIARIFTAAEIQAAERRAGA